MSKVSILIPSKNERLLAKSIEEIFNNVAGEFEVIVVLDGPTSFPLPHKRENLIFIHKPRPEGIRRALNDAAARATGKYLFKTDAHCMLGPGFDQILQEDCDDDWVVIPRRFGMRGNRPDLWERQLDFVADYYYHSCPWTSRFGLFLGTQRWVGKGEERQDVLIDDTMGMHGSAWFMPTHYYRHQLEGLFTQGASTYGDGEEIPLKTWLGGGRVVVNKRTWYAHLQLKADPQSQHQKDSQSVASCRFQAQYWTTNQWPKQIHDFDWLIDKFWPLPTSSHHHPADKYFWPDNWKELYSTV